MTDRFETRILLNGQLCDAEGAERPAYAPATGARIATIRDASPEQVDQAVRAARAAFPDWSSRIPADRAAHLLAIADMVEANAAELARLEHLDTGKPYAQVLGEEIPMVADVFRFYAGAIRTTQAQAAGEYLKGFTSYLRRDAIGVVAGISPWNYPLLMATWKMAPCLAAGNTLVLKPSEETSLSILKFAGLVVDILPPGVLNIIPGAGGVIGSQLINHDQIDMISVTGSIRTGQFALEAAIPTIKRTHLELGGLAPAIVFEDADLDKTVQGLLFGGFYNAGQDCTAASRLLVAQGIHDRFVDAFQTALAGLSADSASPGPTLGPLITKAQQESVLRRIDAAGDRALRPAGFTPPDAGGYWVGPTILLEPAGSDAEIFGPAVTVTPFKDEDAAIAMANATKYGLASSVWTENIGRAMRVTGQLRFGCSWVNTHQILATEMPHGGLKQSGYGSDLSVSALNDYSVNRHIMIAH
ncbi:aldehyde dehydrogenase family protein [Paracoccus sp. S1E-3]|uniref:aldehyde dehydrogenase family protein n=1 Tax=Paracoccus sp. S1E-3 TaxID=2756130 RepID=UPI0015EEE031|nr:aldehyde dehydrogenase family protein [Paracoccus sp. S1E-3]MBA4491473.1 aldehyde dehydrogenase family protein [Paracoccus sp. S1E-3]